MYTVQTLLSFSLFQQYLNFNVICHGHAVLLSAHDLFPFVFCGCGAVRLLKYPFPTSRRRTNVSAHCTLTMG